MSFGQILNQLVQMFFPEDIGEGTIKVTIKLNLLSRFYETLTIPNQLVKRLFA
jgi:hypothetical protein